MANGNNITTPEDIQEDEIERRELDPIGISSLSSNSATGRLSSDPIDSFFSSDTNNPSSSVKSIADQFFGQPDPDRKRLRELRRRKQELSPVNLRDRPVGSPARGETGIDTRSMLSGVMSMAQEGINSRRRDKFFGDEEKANSASFLARAADAVGLNKLTGRDFSERSRERRSEKFGGFADELISEELELQGLRRKRDFEDQMLSDLVTEDIQRASEESTMRTEFGLQEDLAETEGEIAREELEAEGEIDKEIDEAQHGQRMEEIDARTEGDKDVARIREDDSVEVDERASTFRDLSTTGQNIYEAWDEYLEAKNYIENLPEDTTELSDEELRRRQEFEEELPDLRSRTQELLRKFSNDRVNSIIEMVRSDRGSDVETAADALGIGGN